MSNKTIITILKYKLLSFISSYCGEIIIDGSLNRANTVFASVTKSVNRTLKLKYLQ